jgi:hypothetical protein
VVEVVEDGSISEGLEGSVNLKEENSDSVCLNPQNLAIVK